MQTIETERAQPNGRNNNIIHQQEQEEAVLNSNQTIGTVESIFQNKYTEVRTHPEGHYTTDGYSESALLL